MNQIHHGDCLDVLRTMAADSVDAIVTDPPYGLSFMGKKWDYDVPGVDVWAECLRVLKPGGHLLAFAGTRTQHRMACRIEDAGFEIRDMIAWVYGSGFPKSHNGEWGGTALKPSLEPITMARKPLAGTVDANWRAHGTGALNIDGCRVAHDDELRAGAGAIPCRHEENTPRGRSGQLSADQRYADVGATNFAALPGPRGGAPEGRWPANLIHDGSDDVVAAFPNTVSGTGAVKRASSADEGGNTGAAYGAESRPAGTAMICHGDAGSAARFFYCAKADQSDRNEGLYGFGAKKQDDARKEGKPGGDNPRNRGVHERKNHHPTVKPTDLMRYLCRLVTPAGGIVLDPFMGSGSTGRGAVLEGFRFIGIEREAEYVEIARARIDSARRQGFQPGLILEAA